MTRCEKLGLDDDRPAAFLVGLVMDAMDALGDIIDRSEDMSKDDIVAEIADIQANLQIADAMCADVLTAEYKYVLGAGVFSGKNWKR